MDTEEKLGKGVGVVDSFVVIGGNDAEEVKEIFSISVSWTFHSVQDDSTNTRRSSVYIPHRWLACKYDKPSNSSKGHERNFSFSHLHYEGRRCEYQSI